MPAVKLKYATLEDLEYASESIADAYCLTHTTDEDELTLTFDFAAQHFGTRPGDDVREHWDALVEDMEGDEGDADNGLVSVTIED